ncbi:hypothetical protein [Photobacterium indicum]|uniref:hypothetical protein n=1 Tax=Photobacterium indicum TaxID=81447 RepID=UPI003D130206
MMSGAQKLLKATQDAIKQKPVLLDVLTEKERQSIHQAFTNGTPLELNAASLLIIFQAPQRLIEDELTLTNGVLSVYSWQNENNAVSLFTYFDETRCLVTIKNNAIIAQPVTLDSVINGDSFMPFTLADDEAKKVETFYQEFRQDANDEWLNESK